jgi:hypothetical protein
MADCQKNQAACHSVENDAKASPDLIQVAGADNGTTSDNLVGPLTNIGGGKSTSATLTSPIASQQEGFYNGRIVGQHDSARRQFGPVSVRFTNLARLPSSGIGVKTGVTAPDGTKGAVTLATSGVIDFYNSGAITPIVGEYLIGGVWAQQGPNGYQNATPARIALNNSALTGKSIGSGYAAGLPTWTGRQGD